MSTESSPSNAGNRSFPETFIPLSGSAQDCIDCGRGERVGFAFDYAYQPIVNLARQEIFAHEALVRGPNGEGAASVLAKVNDANRYSFDQACRVKAIKGAKELGIIELMQGYLFARPAFRAVAALHPDAYR